MSLLDQYLALTHTNVALAFFCYLDEDERPFSTLLLIKVRLKGKGALISEGEKRQSPILPWDRRCKGRGGKI